MTDKQETIIYTAAFIALQAFLWFVAFPLADSWIISNL